MTTMIGSEYVWIEPVTIVGWLVVICIGYVFYRIVKPLVNPKVSEEEDLDYSHDYFVLPVYEPTFEDIMEEIHINETKIVNLQTRNEYLADLVRTKELYHVQKDG